jgi:hypothetical protein
MFFVRIQAFVELYEEVFAEPLIHWSFSVDALYEEAFESLNFES